MTMGINSLGGGASPFDRETFGAAVVSETLGIMNNSGSNSSLAPVDKASAEASLVSKTLENMNSGSSSGDKVGMAQSFNFQQDVLGAHAKGSLINTLI